MRRYSSLLTLLAFVAGVIFMLPLFASADTITLKSGQTYKGIITSEEKDRVQMKLAETGTRIWFTREQVESIEKPSEKQEESKQEDDSAKPSTTPSAASDDVSRARELLKKMREQQEEEIVNKKKTNTVATTPAASEQAVVVPPPAEGSEIEKLIDAMRNGQYYDRLNAIKKLGDLKAKEAIPHLIHYLDDDDYSIRQQSNNSLIKITEKDFGYNPKDRRNIRLLAIDKWKNWYDEEKNKEATSRLKLKFLW